MERILRDTLRLLTTISSTGVYLVMATRCMLPGTHFIRRRLDRIAGNVKEDIFLTVKGRICEKK